MEKSKAIIVILTYMAKVDSNLDDKENEKILTFIQSQVSDSEQMITLYHNLIQLTIEELRIQFDDAVSVLKDLMIKKEKISFMNQLIELTSSDFKITQEESSSMLYISQIWGISLDELVT